MQQIFIYVLFIYRIYQSFLNNYPKLLESYSNTRMCLLSHVLRGDLVHGAALMLLDELNEGGKLFTGPKFLPVVNRAHQC